MYFRLLELPLLGCSLLGRPLFGRRSSSWETRPKCGYSQVVYIYIYIYIFIYIYTSWEYQPFGRVSQLELRRPNSGRPNSGRPNNGRPNIVVVVVVV